MTNYFISGASSGIGREMARQLVMRGDRVAAAARRTDELEALASEVGLSDAVLSIHPLDVTDRDAVERVMAAADELHNGLDVVVVNAGRGGGAPIGIGRPDRNLAVLDVNLLGALAQIESALALFRPRGKGQIVLISSVAATRGLPGSAAVYSASKTALESIGSSLRTELGATEIAITTIRPGYVRTPMTEGNPFPVMSRVEKAAAAIIRAADARKPRTTVPAAWRPVGVLLRILPAGAVRRFT